MQEDSQNDVQDIKDHFSEHTRGILHLACGYGKTFLALQYIKETACLHRTLVLVPNLGLLDQWLTRVRETLPELLVYCIGSKVTKRIGDTRTIYYVGTSSEQMSFEIDTRHIVVCMYQSSFKLINQVFDLLICDEAHHTVNLSPNSVFKLCLSDESIMSVRRLFLTATPKHLESPSPKRKRLDLGPEPSGLKNDMRNIELYGPVILRRTLKEAIDAKRCCDYNVVLYHSTIATGLSKTERRILKAKRSADNLLSTINEFDKKRILLFFSKQQNCLDFMHIVKSCSTIRIACVLSRQDAHTNKQTLCEFSQEGEEPFILCNVDIVSEGVSIDVIDMIGFMDEKSSSIKINQSVGRGTRLSKSKQICTIFIPEFLDEQRLDDGDFTKIRHIVRSLADVGYDAMSLQDKIQTRGGGGHISTELHTKIRRKILNSLLSVHEEVTIQLKPKEGDYSFYPYAKCREVVQALRQWRHPKEFKLYMMTENGDRLIPLRPDKVYAEDGFISMADFLSISLCPADKKEIVSRLESALRTDAHFHRNLYLEEVEEFLSQRHPHVYKDFKSLELQDWNFYSMTGQDKTYMKQQEYFEKKNTFYKVHRMRGVHASHLEKMFLESFPYAPRIPSHFYK